MITLEQINALDRYPGMLPFHNVSEESTLWAPGERFISRIFLLEGYFEVEIDTANSNVEYVISEKGVPIDELSAFAAWLGKFKVQVKELAN